MLHRFVLRDKQQLKCGNKIYTNSRSLNVSEDVIENVHFFQSFILILFLFIRKYYLLLYLDNCAYKIVNKQTIDYFDDRLFETFGTFFETFI